MCSTKYVDYLDKKRIESAFYNPKSKPKTWVGMIAEARKVLQYKALRPKGQKMTGGLKPIRGKQESGSQKGFRFPAFLA